MKQTLLYTVLVLILLTSCGEYNKILKSTDNELKYEYARKFFDQGQYTRAATLLEELVLIYKGTALAEETLYQLARSYYLNKDYETAAQYFKTYYNTYPKGTYSELSRFYTGYGYFSSAPETRLDQKGTYQAINELQLFLEYFPTSEKAQEAQEAIIVLQDRLAEKELLNARLYYNMGDYRLKTSSNNYNAAVITARNAIYEYPYTKWKEELLILILRSKNQEALKSVDSKKNERLRDVVDEYHAYNNDYPEGVHAREAKRIFSAATKYLKEKNAITE